jgi:hypothetical protein
LYPMNALANDQSRRIAKLVHQHATSSAGSPSGSTPRTTPVVPSPGDELMATRSGVSPTAARRGTERPLGVGAWHARGGSRPCHRGQRLRHLPVAAAGSDVSGARDPHTSVC